MNPDDQAEFAELTAVLGEQPMVTTPMLQVHCDVVELLDQFDGDETRLLDFMGRLKDLLA